MKKQVYRQRIEKCGMNVVKSYFDYHSGRLIKVFINNKLVCSEEKDIDNKKESFNIHS